MNKITYIIHKYAGTDENRRFDVYGTTADEVRSFKNKQDQVGITIVFDSYDCQHNNGHWQGIGSWICDDCGRVQ